MQRRGRASSTRFSLLSSRGAGWDWRQRSGSSRDITALSKWNRRRVKARPSACIYRLPRSLEGEDLVLMEPLASKFTKIFPTPCNLFCDNHILRVDGLHRRETWLCKTEIFVTRY